MEAQTRAETGFRQADACWGVVLFVAALALRIPFRSHLAYHWDSAQFALAVGEYNLRIGQPQAPGYYLYVVLGRLVSRFIGEPHAALVWLSVAAGSYLAAAGYLLASSMFGRKCGLGAGLILLTSPLCWFHSEIALTTIVDSALVTSFALLCWRAIQSGVTCFQTAALAAELAAVAGVHQQSAPCLIPLALYVLWHSTRHRAWKILGAAGLTVCFSLLWFVPTVKSAGGFEAYVHLLRLKNQLDAHQTVWGGGGLKALWNSIGGMSTATWVGLLAAGLVGVLECVSWSLFEKPTAKDRFYRAHKSQLCVLTLWIAPMAMFWMLMYVTMPGYVLNFFPAVAILASLGLVRHSEHLSNCFAVPRGWAFCGILGAVMTINSIVFVSQPFWTKRLLVGLPMTGVEIQKHDADLSACFKAIRRDWSTREVVICHGIESFYWGFRQFEYYLPEYTNLLLVADRSLPGTPGTKEWIGYQRQTTFQTGIPIPAGDDILLVVPPGETTNLFEDKFDVRDAHLFLESKVKLYLLHP